ncbi:alpha/beta hydrolase fold domain-containing protein [Candidatus Poribacteria bacterium]
MREPTHRNIPYGPHERNVIDLYLAQPERPSPLYVFIHGGGFQGGDKSNIPQEMLEGFLEIGISVAAINYRLSGTDSYPAAMQDSAYAMQFLRYGAKEWNLDTTRVAAGGGSAGGGITFWIGFRHDLADPNSDDPVKRQSTRLTCIASWNTQASYDPNFIRTIISGGAYAHIALQRFFRVSPEEFETPRAKKVFAEASAINYVSKDAPPVFLWYPLPDLPMTPDLDANAGIHHPKFGQILKERMDELGVECVVRFREDLPGLPQDEIRMRFNRELVEFVARHFGIKGGIK